MNHNKIKDPVKSQTKEFNEYFHKDLQAVNRNKDLQAVNLNTQRNIHNHSHREAQLKIIVKYHLASSKVGILLKNRSKECW